MVMKQGDVLCKWNRYDNENEILPVSLAMPEFLSCGRTCMTKVLGRSVECLIIERTPVNGRNGPLNEYDAWIMTSVDKHASSEWLGDANLHGTIV
jgi:hypothetical protein